MAGTSGSQGFQVPIAKEFSFAIPEVWKTPSSFLLRWIDNVPLSVTREEPLQTTQDHARKRALDTTDSDPGYDEDNHRHKRAKMASPSIQHPGLEKRRNILAKSSRGLMRHVSNVYHNITSSKHRESSDGSTAHTSLPLPGAPRTMLDRPRMRFLFVGDSGCGKSSLLLRYYFNQFDPAPTKSQYELFNKSVVVDGQDVDLELWDTSGNLALHQLKLISYLSWDVVFLCFSVESPMRFAKTQLSWVNEIGKHCGGAPVVLLGLKKDTCMGKSIGMPLVPHLQARLCAAEDSSGATIMRAIKYIQCSAKTGENVDLVFEEAVRIVIYDRAEKEELARIRKGYKDDNEKSGGLAKFLCFK
ncbi:P-loop containing nucleoside triphosphate hydrolase protein [Hypoxylon crocopeplum]|nr:P-loop containing nucleoside triphosphate hydrolase protein [Hypoxylon crocopeplum]